MKTLGIACLNAEIFLRQLWLIHWSQSVLLSYVCSFIIQTVLRVFLVFPTPPSTAKNGLSCMCFGLLLYICRCNSKLIFLLCLQKWHLEWRGKKKKKETKEHRQACNSFSKIKIQKIKIPCACMVDLLLLCRRKKTLSSQECNNKLLCGCTCCYNTCLSEGVFPVQSRFPSFATLKKKKKRLEDCIWKFMFMSLLSL